MSLSKDSDSSHYVFDFFPISKLKPNKEEIIDIMQ